MIYEYFVIYYLHKFFINIFKLLFKSLTALEVNWNLTQLKIYYMTELLKHKSCIAMG